MTEIKWDFSDYQILDDIGEESYRFRGHDVISLDSYAQGRRHPICHRYGNKKHSVEHLTEKCIACVEMQCILKNTVYFKANQVKRAKYGKFSLPQFT